MFTKVNVSIIMDIITPECNMVIITSISDLESGKSQRLEGGAFSL